MHISPTPREPTEIGAMNFRWHPSHSPSVSSTGTLYSSGMDSPKLDPLSPSLLPPTPPPIDRRRGREGDDDAVVVVVIVVAVAAAMPPPTAWPKDDARREMLPRRKSAADLSIVE